MVEKNKKFGGEDFVYNGIEESEYSNGGSAAEGFHNGKVRHGGVGGRASKSNNHKEAKVANRRRNEKRARENERAEEEAKAAWLREETQRW